MNTIDRSPPGQGNQGLVSIIIIFFNAERFIHEAIASVFAQTYANWELLLIDDGSTDGGTEIARRCAEQYPNKVFYLDHIGHQNRGMSATRNHGIRNARGEFIAFLDSDDVWLPHKLEQQTAIMFARPEAGMVYGRSEHWNSWEGNPLNRDSDYLTVLGVEPNILVQPPALLTLSLESKAPTPCPSDMLLRRGIVKAVGGFDESFTGINQLYEDQAFLAKVYLNSPVFVANECWDRYRQHPDSCVSVVTNSGQKYAVGLFYLSWLERYLAANGISDIEVWMALRKKQRRYRYPKLSPWLERVQYKVEQVRRLASLKPARSAN